MGVPGFFVWLMKNNVHNNIILNKLNNINNLYFDANCLFHPKCFDILKLYSQITDVNKLEELMIDRIIQYINYIITFVNPSDNIFIAVDGVAPIAKINQQRKRRYKSVIDKEYNEMLNEKYKKGKNTSWSNIVITPGTKFMIKLDLSLQKLQKENNKIIYSSYKEEGEGEHKIIRYIKTHETKDKVRHVVYGLDADLIFLAMSAHTDKSELFLLRELQHLKKMETKLTEDVKEPLCYLSIENVINTYNEYILSKLEENSDMLEIDLTAKYDFSKDFIIICFMLGNDFVPNLPSINIRINGIEYLTEAYCNMYQYMKSYIYDVNKKEINWDNLKMILEYIGSYEDEFFKDALPGYKRKSQHRRCQSSDPYDVELWRHDNLKDIKVVDEIQLGQGSPEEYKFRYYEHHFKSRINQEKFKNNISKNYLEMIVWITKYYFDIDMPSWQFCYYFEDSPFASDLKNYLDKNKINEQIEYKPVIKIETQLLSVIPSYYTDILNECKINTTKFTDKKTQFMFPIDYDLDYSKDQYWMCEAILPMIDLELIL
jgi:5'-3' exonuclease